MSIQNILKYPYEVIWFAWYPVKVEGRWVWLKKVGKRIDMTWDRNFAGQETFGSDIITYFELSQDKENRDE